MIFRSDRSALKYLGFAAGSIAAASLLTIAIEPLFGGKAPLFFFIVAVVLSAAYGGLAAGLLATAFGVGVAFLGFTPEVLVVAIAHSGLVVFAGLGIGLSIIVGYLKRTNAELRSAKGHLETSNQKLAERSEALSQANEELQRFAYALAHDLNAPLRGIAVLTDLFVQRNSDKIDESSRECAAMITGRVQRMQSMIKGLLDYAAVAEKPEDRGLVDCDLLVQRVIQDLDAVIAESGAQITVGNLPMVRATESHLDQVFANLISNAIKYRPSVRTPQVHISVAERGTDWLFCVRDNGIGLDMKFANDIFGMFKRLHADNQYGGSGIGLALCKIVIERHGGNIWVESELGKGSRFFFTFPKGEMESMEPFTSPREAEMKVVRHAASA
jgi:signal transduction histidine kinase